MEGKNMLYNESELREITKAKQEKNRVETTNEHKTELFVLGVDLGQASDYTAIIGLERVRVTTFDQWREAQRSRIELNDPMSEFEPVFKTDLEYHVRLIERVRLGTSYAEVAKFIYDVSNMPEIAALNPVVVVDAGGVGRAIVDMLNEVRLETVKAITTTGGEKVTQDGAYYWVPKSELASRVKGLFGRGILKIANGLKERDNLIRELENFTIKRTDAGHARFEAANNEIHDDLVSALSFAAFIAVRHTPVPLISPHEIKKDPRDPLICGGPHIRRGMHSGLNQRWPF